MIDFSSWLDLPLIWGILIASVIFIYVFLDGFDLGCGILFPFVPSNKDRDKIMNSIAPFWDGNETWLVLGGGGLMAAFPLAYAILMPALYLPIIFMLFGLIFRGAAFEFRFKSSKKQQKIWDIAFHGGSLLAAFMQGIILGNIIQGVEISNRNFAGGSLDWANGFAIFTGISLIFGYALLGSTWLIMKTDEKLQNWARKAAKYVLSFVAIAMLIVTISMPLIDERIVRLWFSLPNFFYLLPIPILTLISFIILYRDLFFGKAEIRPFILSIIIFFLAYIGIGISIFPYIVPFNLTIWQAAAASTSQSIILVGVSIFLPIILGYTAYVYWVFRGKANEKKLY
jgi:cytochrome d ubiquinol oxidase subunit II